ncbi:MAG: cytochrome c-type biogenesis protein CcmE [Pseudomonadota bacterium]|nr:MAG: cytochrome c-type biogenesis protein CcmE [Pseudomonadota bacterium]
MRVDEPKRKQRLFMTTFILLATAGTVSLVFVALEQNMNMFYPPADVVQGKVPANRQCALEAWFWDGSVRRADDIWRLLTLTDHQGSRICGELHWLLPDFVSRRSGKFWSKALNQNGVFEAVEVLAKHDENYMPPELMDMPGTPMPIGKSNAMPGLSAPVDEADGLSKTGSSL